MASWLRCDEVGEGMLPGEYAVVTSNSEGQSISLFASEKDVQQDKRLLRILIIRSAGDKFLVYLPTEPLENTSRTVKVPATQIFGES